MLVRGQMMLPEKMVKWEHMYNLQILMLIFENIPSEVAGTAPGIDPAGTCGGGAVTECGTRVGRATF